MSERYIRYCRKYNEDSNESPWIGTEEPMDTTPSEKEAQEKDIKEDEDENQSLITKNKDVWSNIKNEQNKYLSF